MNPYVPLLQEALRGVGIDCRLAEGLSPKLVRSWEAADVLHLHWVELLYATPHLTQSVRRLLRVLAGLLWARAKGRRIVYTVHNLNPHDQAFPLLDRLARGVLFRLADALHVHDEEAKDSLARAYASFRKPQGAQRVHVIPHGSYIGVYPNVCTKEEARQKLGLPGKAFVYLFLGQIRRYKGIEDLVAAFDRLGDVTCRLVIAGNVHDAAHAGSLAELLSDRAEIRSWFRYVPDAEVQCFMNACDVCVLPYREVTTSGAAILAFSFGRAIIAPALGGFPELAAGGRGIVYEPGARDGLLIALRQARLLDMAAAGQSALRWAEEHRWPNLAPRFARMYVDVLPVKKPPR